MSNCLVLGSKNFFVLLSSTNIEFGHANPFSYVLLLSLLGLIAFLVAVGRK